MIENGMISIIVPMYNCAKYAPKCIENILSQSYRNWELWLIHGDSDDGTEQVCQKYEDQDDRIHNIFHIDGLVPARNVGYYHATGEWIMYIDGDDWIDEDCLVELMEVSHKHNNPDVVFWKIVENVNNNQIKGKWSYRENEKEHVFEGADCQELAYEAMDYKCGIGESFAKLIRRSFCIANDLHQNSNLRQGMEGWEFSLRLFYQASRILYVNKTYNHYRYNPNSLSKVVSEKNALYIRDSLVEIHKFIQTMPESDKYRFKNRINQRTQYAILAVAMSTYFHPNNKLKYHEKMHRFDTLINENEVFYDALAVIDYSIFDKKRAISLFCIKRKMYWLLPIISRVKSFLSKKGIRSY